LGDPAPRARDFIKSKKLPAQLRNSI